MAITLDQLCECMPTLPRARAQGYIVPLVAAMSEFHISYTNRRAAAFLAQLGHESCDLKWWAEIWGPTPAQLRYEGRKDLGNTQAGDGYRYRGRGPIQLTGRHNYRLYGEILGVDLEANPALASSPAYGFRIAGLYWERRNINALCDAIQSEKDFERVTRAVNGGLNGHANRLDRYRHCLKVLG